MSKKGFIGVDLGSVSTNIVWITPEGEPEAKVYLRTRGKPINTLQEGLELLGKEIGNAEVLGLGTTGSGRVLAGKILGADTITNEITCHGLAAEFLYPGVRTVVEIGGQDSKIIFLREGLVWDFAMNTVCAAGTGSFLEQQSSRLGITVSELGEMALASTEDIRIAGRCAVFAESDMIHKQQLGYPLEDIVAGLCRALVRNYLNNLAKGKKILGPVLFQGGVAANPGMHKALEEALAMEVTVPAFFDAMGAIGAGLLARERQVEHTLFRGFDISGKDYRVESKICKLCPNQCEILMIMEGKEPIALWGAQCPRGEVIEKDLSLSYD